MLKHEPLTRTFALPLDRFLPAIGSIWLHKNGDAYEVYDVTNHASDRRDEYPIRVSYRRLRDNSTWSKDLFGFLKSRQRLGVRYVYLNGLAHCAFE
jgi:hypothetical protein